MKPEEVREVLEVQQILGAHSVEVEFPEDLIASLIHWRHVGQVDINLTVGSSGPSEATVTPRGKRGKGTEVPDDEPAESEF